MKILRNLSESDRRAIYFLVGFFLLIALYWLLSFSFAYRQISLESLEANSILRTSMGTHGKKVAALYAKDARKDLVGQDQSLLAVVTSTASDKQIVFKRFQPDGATKINVWLEQVNFNSFLLWIAQMDAQNGIHASQLSVERSKRDGYVDARVTLVR